MLQKAKIQKQGRNKVGINSAYSYLIPTLFLPYSCLISALFLDFWLSAAYSAYSYLIPTLFLPCFWILAFCSIFCLFLPYSCIISALFFDFGFLQHILLIPALFLAYSCLIFGFWLSAAYYAYSYRIPALFLAYSFFIFGFLFSAALFCLFLPYSCLIFWFCFLQHILLIPALFLAYSWLIPALFLLYFFIFAFCGIFCLFLAYYCLIRSLYYSCLIPALFLYVCFLHPYFADCFLAHIFLGLFQQKMTRIYWSSMWNLFVTFWQQTTNRKFVHIWRWWLFWPTWTMQRDFLCLSPLGVMVFNSFSSCFFSHGADFCNKRVPAHCSHDMDHE